MQTAALIFLFHVLPAIAAGQVDTVVVCPTIFRDSLEPWLKYRHEQGHRIAVITENHSSENIRRKIRLLASGGKLQNILLVGDAEPAAAGNQPIRARSVPTHHAKAKVNIHWGSEPEIATDNWFADLDDDQIPDLAVGRLTADSPEELAVIVQKILSYENTHDAGFWRRRVNFVAGGSGFGFLVDAVLESVTKKIIAEGIPSAYNTSMTYGNWRSPYCPDPRNFHLTTIQRLNEGCLFWVYLGHGQGHSLDRMQVPGKSFHVFNRQDVAKLSARQGAPIAVLLTCYAGAYDSPLDCMAEEMLRRPGAPVAILCGSRVTMPYAMSVMGAEMLRQYFEEKRQTLGEVFLHAKKSMVSSDSKSRGRKILDLLGKTVSPSAANLAAERAEHVLLFNLLGDPLLRLRHPHPVDIEVDKDAIAGELLEIKGSSAINGHCTIELVCRRDRLTFTPPSRYKYDPSEASLAAFEKVYQRANDQRWVTQTLEIDKSSFQAKLKIPSDALGSCHVRVFVEGNQEYALGAADVYVRRPGMKTVSVK